MKYQKILGLVATAGLLLAGCATDSDNRKSSSCLSCPCCFNTCIKCKHSCAVGNTCNCLYNGIHLIGIFSEYLHLLKHAVIGIHRLINLF